jgi:rhodanese-related sulfurtransferase
MSEFAMSPEDLAELLKSKNPPHLLDVRQPEEHETAALPNSKLIPLGQIVARAKEIESWKDEDVVVYCHHGVRSLMAIGGLRAMGFKKLHNLSGGIDSWSVKVDSTVPRY